MKFALALALALGAAFAASAAEASMRWRWTCVGQGFEAKGLLTTGDAPDGDGFYPIIGVTGEANGVAITGLQAAKTAIPGNEGWPVDNLVRLQAPQLSPGGFGFRARRREFRQSVLRRPVSAPRLSRRLHHPGESSLARAEDHIRGGKGALNRRPIRRVAEQIRRARAGRQGARGPWWTGDGVIVEASNRPTLVLRDTW